VAGSVTPSERKGGPPAPEPPLKPPEEPKADPPQSPAGSQQPLQSSGGGVDKGEQGVSKEVHMKLQKRVEELERTLRDTQALLEMRTANPAVMIDDLGLAKRYSASPKLDATGTYNFPVEKPGKPHPPQGYSPRARMPGGYGGATVASEGAQGTKLTLEGMREGADVEGPPFRSQAERRQWLLQEKRRWLVEMRLGKSAPDAVSGTVSSPRLPPLDNKLSSGANMDTIATPR